MNQTLQELIGTGKDLTTLQMSVRAFIFFFVTLAYIRIAGMRTFGKQSAFDMIIVIVLGSVISRGIAGASGFTATLASSLVLVVIHRLVSFITYKSHSIEKLVKGKQILLFENGNFHEKNMAMTGISMTDFLESLRQETQSADVDNILQAWMERSGKVSFILKKKS